MKDSIVNLTTAGSLKTMIQKKKKSRGERERGSRRKSPWSLRIFSCSFSEMLGNLFSKALFCAIQGKMFSLVTTVLHIIQDISFL